MVMVKVSSKLHNHPSLIELKDRHGSDAVLSLFRLWLWCADNGVDTVSEAEVRYSGYQDDTHVSRPIHQDVLVESHTGDKEGWYDYISTLMDLKLIELVKPGGKHPTYKVKNPFISITKEEPKVNNSKEITQVIDAYMAKFPSYPRQGVDTESNRALIADRLEGGWDVSKLIEAIEGMSQTQWYQENTDLSLRYAVISDVKVSEHIVKRNKKPSATSDRVGHHSGSRSFGSGRSSSF